MSTVDFLIVFEEAPMEGAVWGIITVGGVEVFSSLVPDDGTKQRAIEQRFGMKLRQMVEGE